MLIGIFFVSGKSAAHASSANGRSHNSLALASPPAGFFAASVSLRGTSSQGGLDSLLHLLGSIR
jgi:hypothetical protein